MVIRYLARVFLNVLPYGVLFGFTLVGTGGRSGWITRGVVVGLVWAMGMSLLLGWTSWNKTRPWREQGGKGVPPVRYSEMLLTGHDTAEAFRRCRNALAARRKCRIREENETEGRLRATTGIDWRSFGEKIELVLRPADGGGTSIRISSRPRFTTAIFDCGEDWKVVRQLRRSIEGGERTEDHGRWASGEASSLA